LLFGGQGLQNDTLMKIVTSLTSSSSSTSTSTEMEEADLTQWNTLLIRWQHLFLKMKKLKALKLSRLKLLYEHHELLVRIQEQTQQQQQEEENSNNNNSNSHNPALTSSSTNLGRIQQNIVDGAMFTEDGVVSIEDRIQNNNITENYEYLQEIFQEIGKDQKEEELFWRWIANNHTKEKSSISSSTTSVTTTASNTATMANNSSSSTRSLGGVLKPLLDELNDIIYETEDKTADILNSESSIRSISIEQLLQQSTTTTLSYIQEQLTASTVNQDHLTNSRHQSLVNGETELSSNYSLLLDSIEIPEEILQTMEKFYKFCNQYSPYSIKK
jgi:hypothetical protein